MLERTTKLAEPLEGQIIAVGWIVARMSEKAIHTAVIHPIVLLSVVDHYTREAAQTQRRVCGVLLGSLKDGVVDITNCFAGEVVLFMEKRRRSLGVWFLGDGWCCCYWGHSGCWL